MGTPFIIHLTTTEQDQLYRQQQETNKQLDVAAKQAKKAQARLESMVQELRDLYDRGEQWKYARRFSLEAWRGPTSR